ncbi:MAG: cell envelope integrity protein TolA [Aquincola sp.]|nr:cell envelope integrity protein TolA [Aquincola sp.]MDH5329288.1 cell envelope integrity protein TolA [Aquincola sp.]
MSSRAATLDALRPRRPGGMGRGAMLALVVHVGLVIALAFGVSWRSHEPAGVTAELWAAVPEIAAPAPVTPPAPEPRPAPKVEPAPPPPQPDAAREAEIAIEKAKIEKQKREEKEAREKAEALEKQRLQEEAAAKAREEKAKAERAKAEKAKAEKAEAERIAKLRDENLKRIQGQAGATGAPQSTGTALRDAGPSANYAGRIVARVRPNIVLTESVPPTLRAEVEVRAAPDGTIIGRRLVKSSGNKDWDDAVLRAIDRTEVLPRDTDGRVPSPMVLGFTPS